MFLGIAAVAETGKRNQRYTPTAMVRIHGHEVKALMDTGSEVTAMPTSLYEKIKRDVDIVPKANYNLRTASGEKIHIRKTCRAMIKIGKKARRAEMQVVDNLVEGYIILGADFLTYNNAVMDLANRTIKLGKEVQLDEEWGEQCKIKICGKLSLAPGEEGIIKGLSNEPNAEYLAEAVDLPANVIPLPGVTQSDAQRGMFIHVANAGTETVHLDKHNVMALAIPSKYYQATELEKAEKELEKRVHKKPTELSNQYVRDNANLENVPTVWKEKFWRVLEKFPGVYARNHLDVGDCPVLPHRINISAPEKVVNIPPYRVPYHLERIQHSYVDELLAARVIRPSDSPWSSPILMVRKQNADPKLPLSSQYRLVHNYKKVNELINPPSYPLSNLYQLLDEVASKKIFSVLDLSQGYFNQRCLDPHGATAFNVPGRGTFQYCKSPMGINSSPSNFQKLTEYVIRDIPGAYVYLDDIIIGTDDYASHCEALALVLQRLQHYDLRINLRKATFGKETVTYLGYQISNKSIMPGKRKTQAILDAKPPQNVKQIKQFLGLCGFFRKTIPRFSEISAPLNKLVRKDSGYENGPLPDIALQAFKKLQSSLGSRPTLTPVNFDREFIVTIDTSKIAHGAILSQKDEKGEERICAYASSLLPDSKINRPAIQLEKEGIRWALQHFRPYLLGREFLIRTDHKPLVSLAKGTVDITDSVSAEIQKYLPFRVEYLPGNKMPADYLSRPVCLTRKIREVQGKRDERSAIGTTTWKSDNQRLSAELIKMAQLSDNVCKALAVFLRYKSYPKNPLLKAQVVSLAPTCKLDSDGLIVNRQSQILIPDSLKGEIIMRSHDEMGHRNADTSLANATQFFFWENMKKDFIDHISGCKVCLQSKPGYGKKRQC